MRVGSPYHMYMMEQAGMLNTRESQINAAIRELQKCGAAAADISVQKRCFQNCGLDMNSLTKQEIRRIEAVINK